METQKCIHKLRNKIYFIIFDVIYVKYRNKLGTFGKYLILFMEDPKIVFNFSRYLWKPYEYNESNLIPFLAHFH